MAIIIPSILEESLEGLNKKISEITLIPGVKHIQVDFGDGIFIPKKLVSIGSIHNLNSSFRWEAHLMVNNPDNFSDYKYAGFTNIIIQVEAFSSLNAVKGAVAAIQKNGLVASLCFKNETDVALALNFKDSVKNFQIMGVVPGAQGGEFLESTYEKIKELRKLIPNAILQVDGGLSETNIKKLFLAGADRVVAGSALRKAPTMAESYALLEQALK